MIDPVRWPAAVRGAIGFLTRLPVPGGRADGDWTAFRSRPATFPLAGAVVGLLAAIPLLGAGVLPGPTVALGYLLAVYLVTGIHHLDGVADVGDAAIVHGDATRRREVLSDTTTGVGALLAVSIVVAGVGLAGLGLAGAPVAIAVGVAVAAEVGAKTGMAALACFGTAAHEGLGSQLTDASTPSSFVLPAAIALPAASATWPHPAGTIAFGSALAGAIVPWLWGRRAIGGVSGDVFGAANEVGRVCGLHAGVIAWTLS